MNSMLISVSERRREIGIKKSLGAGNIRIVCEFLAESVLLTVSGSVIGATLGTLLCMSVCALIGEQFSCDYNVLFISIAASAVIGMLSGSYPAYKAARMKPIEALKG